MNYLFRWCKENKFTLPLLVSCLCFFISIFICKPYYFAFGVTQFVLTIAIYMFKLTKPVSKVLQYNEKRINSAHREGNPIKIVLYEMAMPTVGVGVFWIVILTIAVWFIKF